MWMLPSCPPLRDGRGGSSAPSRIHEGELGAAEGPTVDQTIENGGASGGDAESSEAQVENRAPGGKNQLVDPSPSYRHAPHIDMFPQNLCEYRYASHTRFPKSWLGQVSKRRLLPPTFAVTASGCPGHQCLPAGQDSRTASCLAGKLSPNRDRRLCSAASVLPPGTPYDNRHDSQQLSSLPRPRSGLCPGRELQIHGLVPQNHG